MSEDLESRTVLPLPVIGWKEWVALPDLGVEAITAKIDTGARTSALHAFGIETYRANGVERVRFQIHPLQKTTRMQVQADAELLEIREVRSSDGQVSRRPAIRTTVSMVGETWPIELTLCNRDLMEFRLLLGRTALCKRVLVDCNLAYCDSSCRTPPS